MPNLKVVKDRVLVEIEALPEKTSGGLFLPENREERDRIGIVRSVGGLVKTVQSGERVLYNVYSQSLEVDGKSYRVVKEENLLAVVDNGLDVRVPAKAQGSAANWENLD